MKIRELRTLNSSDMAARLAELKKELMKARAEVAVSSPKNPGKIRQIKRSIAQIITVTSEKASVKTQEVKAKDE